MHQALFGSMGNTNILDVFMQVIPDCDRILLQDALQSISSVDEDEFVDFLSRHDAKTIPTDDNLNAILTEIAHKENIQMPMFVAVYIQSIFPCEVQWPCNDNTARVPYAPATKYFQRKLQEICDSSKKDQVLVFVRV